jgi:hypothetical protein
MRLLGRKHPVAECTSYRVGMSVEMPLDALRDGLAGFLDYGVRR